MCNNLFSFLFYLIYITDIVGCWHVKESASYDNDKKGDFKLIHREVANVSPMITFHNNGKGTISYCFDKSVSFDWQILSDSTIDIKFHDKRTDRHIVHFSKRNNSLILREYKESNFVDCYKLERKNYAIEEFLGDTKLRITRYEEDLLKKSNPFPFLRCYIAKGRKKGKTLRIEGQEYPDIVNGNSLTQYVFFFKTSMKQKKIPCFLVTHDLNGSVLYTNFITYVELEQQETQERQ